MFLKVFPYRIKNLSNNLGAGNRLKIDMIFDKFVQETQNETEANSSGVTRWHIQQYGFCLFISKPEMLTEAYFGHKMSASFPSVTCFFNHFSLL
jgi:hypothetical protein